MALKPEYLSLNQLLNQRLFSIPNYQRAYCWETKQRKDLFDDIDKLHKSNDKNRTHFMATLVCLKTNQQEEYGTDILERLDVVDGQQRLTTLILLLRAIAKQLVCGDAAEKDEASQLEKLLVKDEHRLILLQTNHDHALLFRNYLVQGRIPDEKNIKTSAEHNLSSAIKESEKYVEEWCTRDEVLELLKLIKNRLHFIFYALEDAGAVYTVFEVLNSRGLEVDWLDKCKSMLMGIAFELLPNTGNEKIQELHQIWGRIYAKIGVKIVSGREILSVTATLLSEDQSSKPLSAEKALNLLRDRCTKEPSEQLVEVTNWIYDVTEKLVELHQDRRLSAVTDISQARLLAVAIKLSSVLKPYEIKTALEWWEKVTFRIYGLFRRDSRFKVGEYTRLSHQIINNQLSKGDIIESIKNIGVDHAIDDAVKLLKEADCYNGWETELKYFLYRYEEYLSKLQGESLCVAVWEKIWSGSASNTIEHIHPQKLTEDWKNKISYRQDYVEKHVHRLGNLLLLPPKVNSQCGAKKFDDKKLKYRTNYLKMMESVLNEEDWTRVSIEKREKELIVFAIKTWGDTPV